MSFSPSRSGRTSRLEATSPWQDEDGVWCASAQLRPGAGAVGDGPTAEAAVADLRGALEALLA